MGLLNFDDNIGGKAKIKFELGTSQLLGQGSAGNWTPV